MKNKILSLTLCFTILMSSLSINRSYAFTSTISVPMVGVLGSIAVASGVSIGSLDDLYDFASEYKKYHNSNMDMIKEIFNSSIKVGINGVVSVGSDFLDTVKEFLNYYHDSKNHNAYQYLLGSVGLIPAYVSPASNYRPLPQVLKLSPGSTYQVSKEIKISVPSSAVVGTGFKPSVYYNGETYTGTKSCYLDSSDGKLHIYLQFYNYDGDNPYACIFSSGYQISKSMYGLKGSVTSAPNVSGLDYGKIDSNIKDSSIDLNVPKDLSNLVGSNSDTIINGITSSPSYDLPVDGVVTLPGVDNPSIELDDVVTLPNVSDTPTDTPIAGTWDWLINLVVPSSTYWSNTFDTFFTNIGNAFPMINVNRFKDLCINGVPPKDIEVTIMGAKGKIFNTKYLNSIIDWLQPIVSAFMAFLLMLYNYRKVYKLIRGFEPFSGIADGNSVGEVRGKMDGAMPEMGGSSFVGPSTASTWSDGQSVTRGSIQSRYYGRDL